VLQADNCAQGVRTSSRCSPNPDVWSVSRSLCRPDTDRSPFIVKLVADDGCIRVSVRHTSYSLHVCLCTTRARFRLSLDPSPYNKQSTTILHLAEHIFRFKLWHFCNCWWDS